jgi:hypothetical protein
VPEPSQARSAASLGLPDTEDTGFDDPEGLTDFDKACLRVGVARNLAPF